MIRELDSLFRSTIFGPASKLKSGVDIHSGKAGIRPKRNDDFRGPVELAGVSPGTPAAKAGLKSGDRILKVGTMDIRWPNHLRHALGVVDAENKVAITVERDGETLEYECELVKELPVYRTPFIGFLPICLTRVMASK